LQQATSMARLAEAQLGFERQEVPPAFIQADYWEPPQPPPATAAGQPVETHGLTGSERLLRDIYQLDQYAFRTDQRKLQLTKTISLALLDPLGFQRVRETGLLRFRTPMTLFDRDFPGHYLRLIKRVRTSLIALVPPMQGIRATLSTTGTSRVVIGGNTFKEVVVQRGPETVALSSPAGATGLFDLDAQPEMLVPFEHIGVDATWQFSLPKPANPFDYGTIADILLTIDYTALANADYRAQVVEHLGSTVHLERPFSFRNDLPDQWYDLHNSDQTATPMAITFRTGREDFTPHVDALAIEHVALYFAPAADEPPTSWETDLRTTLAFKPDRGTPFPRQPAKPIRGVITTRSGVGNAQAWQALASKEPVGTWQLALPTGAKQIFEDEQIADIIFVITYQGELPAWPDS
jgi:Tc toxin complex TcA C-terminal TcB-binding domain